MDIQRNNRAVHLREFLGSFQDTWSPKVIAELNDVQFKLAKLHGEFVWHVHEDTDEAFIVVKGTLEIAFRDRVVLLHEGELFVVPRGEEHITRAQEECHVLIIEPRGVINTGDATSDLTAPLDDWL